MENIVMKIKIKATNFGCAWEYCEEIKIKTTNFFYLQLMVIGVLGKSGVSAPNPVVAEFKSE